MKFSEYPFLRYVSFFITGILSHRELAFIEDHLILGLLLLLYIVYFLLIRYNFRRKKYHFQVVLPLLAYLMLVLSGLYVAKEQRWQNERGMREMPSGIKGYLAMVLDHDEDKPRSKANRIQVIGTYNGEQYLPSAAEVMVYHNSELDLGPGDLVWVGGEPLLIPQVANPAVFDYRSFLIRQGITHRQYVGQHLHLIGQLDVWSVEGTFAGFRSAIIKEMEATFSDLQALQVAKALLIGQKKNLDPEISEAYVSAGAMHVLAVSGLHVGIIYGFFFLFIKPFRLPIATRAMYLTGIIILIWGYACLTGLSPSVMRAATMFSFMAMAHMKSRNSSIFNAVALSALVLLLYDPELLYAVGFQLSYGALLGILLFQPLLVRLWYPNNKLMEYIWQISTVGIAAQIATFPISAHYFNVFPTYFLFSNIVAIPGAFVVMSLGIPYMLLSNVPGVGFVLGWSTQKVIQLVNMLVFSIQEFPFSRIEGIYFNPHEIVFYLILLGMIYILWTNPNKFTLKLFISYLFFLAFLLNSELFFRQEKELIVYVDEKGFALDYRDDGYCFTWNAMPEQSIDYQAKPYRFQKADVTVFSLLVFQQENKTILPLPVSSFLIIEKDSLHFGNGSSVKNAWQWSNSGWESYNSPKPGSFKLNGKGLKFDLI